MFQILMLSSLMKQTPKLPDEQSLREQAYQNVKKMILNEEVPPNGFLSERNLATQFGMSKTPVRLAIARLEIEGFVRVSPQQGIVVVSLGFDEILDYIEYRLALESFVVRSLAGNINKAQATLLEESLAQHQKLILKKGDNREAQVYEDMAFHKLLATLKGNQQIVNAIIRQQAMLYRVAMRILEKHPTRALGSFSEHQYLVQAIKAGQKNQAVELIENHILNIKTLLIGPA
jgi:DNA-binding GntR family transcriptional regulator